MSTLPKRSLLGRGKGYLNLAGPQSRFIIFLVFVLMAYTLLLRVFQKLAEILQLPVFLPLSLISLLIFIGVVGTIYSHSFVGPMIRIRKAIDQLAQGDISVSLRLRDSDDPMLKELVDAIGRLCEHTRNAHAVINESAQDLLAEIQGLQQAIRGKSDRTEIEKILEQVIKKREILAKAVHAFEKP